MTTTETINAVRSIVKQAEKFKGCYLWRPEKLAGARRSMEKRESRDTVEWTEGGHTYTARFVVECNCRHTEAHGYYTKDGKKTTLTAIRNSLKRMEVNA